MSKLLKSKEGKLFKKNGKLVRTDNPANCDCCGDPPPPPVKYICAIREDSCAQFPLNYGQYQYRSDGVWAIRRSRCAGQIPADTCTIADPPSRPGAFPGEIVNVGCKAVAPITTKECITEEEFNKGGWTKLSGPHDTLQICEAACNPPPPCPGGKFCTWNPPDPCSTGKCTSSVSDTPVECPEGFPYDCTSEEACNQWYEAHPNPPCDCWFCEDGEWVNNPSLTCLEEGGFLGLNPPEGVDCLPPPGQLWCCDGGTEGYFCGERVNVPGIGEMIGDAPIGICNSVKKVDDCSECGPPPCTDGEDAGVWQLELCDEEDCGFPVCGDSPPNGVGRRFATRKECEDCHRDARTCNKQHPLCWDKPTKDNPLP